MATVDDHCTTLSCHCALRSIVVSIHRVKTAPSAEDMMRRKKQTNIPRAILQNALGADSHSIHRSTHRKPCNYQRGSFNSRVESPFVLLLASRHEVSLDSVKTCSSTNSRLSLVFSLSVNNMAAASPQCDIDLHIYLSSGTPYSDKRISRRGYRTEAEKYR